MSSGANTQQGVTVVDTDTVVRKIHWALLPLFIATVVFCYLDRTSLAFAALQLCDEEWFTPETYGFGSGVFYWGYVLFQIPSNLMLTRVGAPRWLGFIIFAWGIVSACCCLMDSRASFFILRLLLGITEAGAFPGLWYLAGQFYPREHLTLPFSIMEACIALSQIIAAPLAAALLQLDGVGGLEGWQWLFLLQGSATMILAVVLWRRLPRSIDTAAFLTDAEKEFLTAAVARPAKPAAGDGGRTSPNSGSSCDGTAIGMLREVLSSLQIWHLVGLKMLKDVALDGLMYWTPTLVAALSSGTQLTFQAQPGSHTNLCAPKAGQSRAVLLTAIPFTFAAAAAVTLGHTSQASREVKLHIAAPLLAGGLAFLVFPLAVQVSVVAGFISLTLALVGADATTGPFWTWVHAAATGPTSAVSFAFVNSAGKAGGFFGPYLFGLLISLTGSKLPSVLLIGSVLCAAGAVALLYREDSSAAKHFKDLKYQKITNKTSDELELTVSGAA